MLVTGQDLKAVRRAHLLVVLLTMFDPDNHKSLSTWEVLERLTVSNMFTDNIIFDNTTTLDVPMDNILIPTMRTRILLKNKMQAKNELKTLEGNMWGVIK